MTETTILFQNATLDQYLCGLIAPAFALYVLYEKVMDQLRSSNRIK
ncbi:hypothetical protein [Fibrisoma limi]|nr:hypothetical protein [Fibrisoma limi]